MAAETVDLNGGLSGPWPMGLNNWRDQLSLRPEELSEALDVDVDSAGQLSRRPALWAIRQRSAAAGDILFALPGFHRPYRTTSPSMLFFGHNSALANPSDDRTLDFWVEVADSGFRFTTGNVSQIKGSLPQANLLTDFNNQIISSPTVANTAYTSYACYGRTTMIFKPATDLAGGNAGPRITSYQSGSAFGGWYVPPEGEFNPDTGEYNRYDSATLLESLAVNGSSDGHLPPSRVLYVYQSGTGTWLLSVYGRNIRWSMPLSPDETRGFQDFRQVDKASIPVGYGEVTAVIQMRNMLLAFTQHSVWAFRGATPYQWQADKLSDHLGTGDQSSVVFTPYGVIFLDTTTGSLWRFDGQSFVDLWHDRLRISAPDYDWPYFPIAYSDGRVYVATRDTAGEGASPDALITVVHDQRTGAITRWATDARWVTNFPSYSDRPCLGITRSDPTNKTRLYPTTKPAAALPNQMILIGADEEVLKAASTGVLDLNTQPDSLFTSARTRSAFEPEARAATGAFNHQDPTRTMLLKAAMLYLRGLATSRKVPILAAWECEGVRDKQSEIWPRGTKAAFDFTPGRARVAGFSSGGHNCGTARLHLWFKGRVAAINRAVLRWTDGPEINA